MNRNSFFKGLTFLSLAIALIITACNKDNNSSDEYITWETTGYSGRLDMPPDSLSVVQWSDATSIFGMTLSFDAFFDLTFPGPQSPGTYVARSFGILADGKYYVPTATPLQVKISNYGTPGGYLIGTYSGPVKDSTTSAIVNLTGTFRVKI